MNPLALLRLSPALSATLATVLAFALVVAGVGMLRRDARVQAVAQCAAEKEVASLRRALNEQTVINLAMQADAKAAAATIATHSEQLAASDEALAKAQKDAEELRKRVASNPGEGDVIFDARDDWLSRRVRPSGSSSPAAGRGR